MKDEKTKDKLLDKSSISKYIQSYQNPLDSVDLDSEYEYRFTIFTYKEGWRKVQRFEKAGWEIVYSKSKDGSDRLEPVVNEQDSLHKSVLMRCLKSRRIQNEKDKIKKNEDKVRTSVNAIKKQGYNVTIQDTDINSISDLEE